MKANWLDSLAAGGALCAVLAGMSFGLPRAEAAPLVIPGLGPEDVQMAPAPVQIRADVAPVMQSAEPSALGGGFLELLLTGRDPTRRMVTPQAPAQRMIVPQAPSPRMVMNTPPAAVEVHKDIDPQFMRQEVDYRGPHGPGTIVIDTPNKLLYLVQGNGRAMRYGIGVGRPGFEWSGVKTISRKAEWPDWTPPPEMLKRRPDLPTHMAGGPENPLGARAMYLGSTMYRIHGTNEPDTIGTNVSSGCIRMMNQDVTDLYERVRVGTKVIVL